MSADQYPPGPYTGREAIHRPDIADRLGPTVASCMTAAFDCGHALGIAVTFAKSGYRHAVKCVDIEEGIAALADFIAEFPYGRGRHGHKWVPRET